MSTINLERLATLLYCESEQKTPEAFSDSEQAKIQNITQELEMLEGLGSRELISCLANLMHYEEEENPDVRKFTYSDFKKILSEFHAAFGKTGQEIHGVIVFTKDSWEEEYSLAARSYMVSSDNGWDSEKDDYAIYGSSLDESDNGVRLERYMSEEQGGPDGWHADYCYLLLDGLDNSR